MGRPIEKMFTVRCRSTGVGRGDMYYGGKVVDLDFQGEYTILTIRYKHTERKIRVYV